MEGVEGEEVADALWGRGRERGRGRGRERGREGEREGELAGQLTVCFHLHAQTTRAHSKLAYRANIKHRYS